MQYAVLATYPQHMTASSQSSALPSHLPTDSVRLVYSSQPNWLKVEVEQNLKSLPWWGF